jgi:rhamnosyltransferase
MIAAVVVLYNPDLSLLERLLESVFGQVDTIVVVDNTPASSAAFSLFFERYQDRVSYIALGENKGIATAQNIGIKESLNAGHDHVLLLDQDSALPVDMVKNLLDAERKLIQAGEAVAAVGPLFVDEKSGNKSCGVRHGWFHVKRIPIDPSTDEPVMTDYLIASGSLIRTSVFEQVGFMLEPLFIDWVDCEWGLRSHSKGFNTYIIPNVIMKHSIGDATLRVLGRDINLHNDTRNYYIVRNAAYLLRTKSMGWRWRLTTVINIPKHIVVHSLVSGRKAKVLKLLMTALLHGMSGNIGRFTEK